MRYFIIGVVASVLAFTSNASAAIVSFGMSVAFSGIAPAGAAPWLTAAFNDGGTTGSVVLTITATNLTGTEKVSEFDFNLDSALNPGNLVFSAPTVISGSFTAPTYTANTNAYKADGDGYYDIQFAFSTASGGAFGSGDAVQYTITGISSLTANSFNFPSSSGESQGMYLAAAHVQGIGSGNNSGWLTTPEPATIALLSIGSLLLFRRKK